MKVSAIIPLCSVLLSGLAYGESVVKDKTMPKVDATVMTAQFIEARLKAIVIEDFNIQKAELSKAIAYLDSVVEPHGLQIYYRPVEGGKEPVVNLKTRELPLSRNLSFLSAQGGYDWWVESGIIIVGLPETKDTLITELIPIQSTTVRRFVETESAK